jgi:hypothetical protein
MSRVRLNTARGRTRGGPAGNTHDLKHGLYSRHISVRDDEEMETMEEDKSAAELAVARSRLADCLTRQETVTDPAEWLALDAAMQGWVGKIAIMTHRKAVLGKDTRMAFVTIMDYIRTANEKQKVVR